MLTIYHSPRFASMIHHRTMMMHASMIYHDGEAPEYHTACTACGPVIYRRNVAIYHSAVIMFRARTCPHLAKTTGQCLTRHRQLVSALHITKNPALRYQQATTYACHHPAHAAMLPNECARPERTHGQANRHPDEMFVLNVERR